MPYEAIVIYFFQSVNFRGMAAAVHRPQEDMSKFQLSTDLNRPDDQQPWDFRSSCNEGNTNENRNLLNIDNNQLNNPADTQHAVTAQAPRYSRQETHSVLQCPKHPRFADKHTRKESFNQDCWVRQLKQQTPEELAEAGFFYAGFNDNVKCFYCNGGLKNWEANDIPWEEHARWFANCEYVKHFKGVEFINKIACQRNTKEINAPKSKNNNSVDPREVKARLDTPMVQLVLNMGYSKQTVRTVIEKRLTSEKDDFPNAESLLNAVFELEDSLKSHSQPVLRSDIAAQSNNDSAACASNSTLGNSIVFCRNNTHDTSVRPKTKAVDKNPMVNAPTNEMSEKVKLEVENQKLKDLKTCKICMDKEANVLLLPCAHLVTCTACTPALRNCPICRANIKGTVKTYMS